MQAEEQYEDYNDFAVEEQENVEENAADVNHIMPTVDYTCRRCKQAFPSNNKLHKHVRVCRDKPSRVPEASKPSGALSKSSTEPYIWSADAISNVIRSTTPAEANPGYGFRNWHYMEFSLQMSRNSPLSIVCYDTGCTMSLIDKAFLYKQCPDVKVQTLSDAINVRGVGDATHQCNTFAVLDFYIPGREASSKAVLAQISREVHIVDTLKAKVLVGMDIIGPERMSANVDTKLLTIGSCEGTIVPVTIMLRPNSKVRRSIRSRNKMTIQPHALMQVPIKIAGILPLGRDLSFQPEYNSNTSSLRQAGAIYAYVVDSNMSFVQVRNDSDDPVVIPRHARLGMVTELEEEGCYAADVEDHKLTGWKPDTAVKVGGAARTTRLPNSVTVHGTQGSPEVLALSRVCDDFLEV